MRKVEVVKPSEVEVTPFVLQDFTTHDTEAVVSEPVSKKELKVLAKELGVAYNDESIGLARKLINAYMKKR